MALSSSINVFTTHAIDWATLGGGGISRYRCKNRPVSNNNNNKIDMQSQLSIEYMELNPMSNSIYRIRNSWYLRVGAGAISSNTCWIKDGMVLSFINPICVAVSTYSGFVEVDAIVTVKSLTVVSFLSNSSSSLLVCSTFICNSVSTMA